MPDLLIQAARLIEADSEAPGWLQIRGDRVVARGTGEPPRPADLRLDVVLPPFVDIHTHGARGVDFAECGVDPGPAIEHHRRNGSTVIEASIDTGPLDSTRMRIAELAEWVRDGWLAGLHLEGPWLSPARCGAHDPTLLRAPDPAEVLDLIGAGDGAVRMITIAPELPGALEAIRAVVSHGVVAALGHTAADAATVRRAIDAGATLVTHLFNGMTPMHHREVGLPGLALLDDRLAVELIADGQHVCDDAIDLVRRDAGDRLLLVSDAMGAVGLGDGEYVLAGSRVRVTHGVARLAEGDSLAGSTSVIREAVERLLARGASHADIVRWTNTNPASVLGLDVPRLRIGDRADCLGFIGNALTHVFFAGSTLNTAASRKVDEGDSHDHDQRGDRQAL
jgi:N-acetylglucosamine-6-phosphate deacetylase